MISSFGTTNDGEEIKKVTLRSPAAGSIQADIITYGAAVQALHVSDKDGKQADVVLGYDTVAEYEVNNPYIGVIVGRVCGRISNAEFKLNGKTHHVSKNHGSMCLHGGFRGLTRRVWRIDKVTDSSVTLGHVTPDGEEGFPGEMSVYVSYSLSEQGNSLIMDYRANVDAPCPIMLTNHSYFNLSGAGNGVVDDHLVHIQASNTLTLNSDLAPTGEVVPLKDTVLDLRVMTRLGDRFAAMSGPNSGFDNYYILDKVGEQPVAEAYEPVSSRRMRVTTDQSGVQFYTANFLDGELGKGGKRYPPHGALCMETHGFPDAVNHANFPSIILNPGEEYKQRTTYTFDIQL